MSTPPKEPKPEEARRAAGVTVEHTFFGVAPAAPDPAAAGAAPAASPAAPSPAAPSPAAPSPAIIATPMISVSDRGKRGAGSPQGVSPQMGSSPQAVLPVAGTAAPAPARASGLQGGWQSAGVPRAAGPEQTAIHGSPGGWPMPPQGTPPAPRVQPAAAPPRPTPAPAAAVTPSPGMTGGLQHTALASDYLRGARDAALGADAAGQRTLAPVPAAAADVGRQTAYSPISAPAGAERQWPSPALGQPAGADLSATAASVGSAPMAPAGAAPLSSHAPVSSAVDSSPTNSPRPAPPQALSPQHVPPPPTKGPPPTAELSSPVPIPFLSATQAPVQVFYTEPDPGHSPRSMGTQASVAPPPNELGASFHGPMAPVIQDATPAPAAVVPVAVSAPAAPAHHAPAAPMSPAVSPVRHAIPQALAGTMLDRTPSIPGGSLPQNGPPPPANPTLRFEQVPAPRSSLAQQATSFGLNIPIDPGGATQWGRTAVEGKMKVGPGKKAKASSQWRMIVLTALALLSVVFAAFGPELRDFALAELDRRRGTGSARSLVPGTPADQTTLTNLPSPGARTLAASAEAVPVGAAPGAVPAAAAPSPAAETAVGMNGAAEPTVAMPAVEATVSEAEPAPRNKRGARAREAKALAEAAAAATPESKLAAEAGRHVLAARFNEALPLYRSLQRDYPQNTAYAAMTKVLEQKLAPAGGTQP